MFFFNSCYTFITYDGRKSNEQRAQINKQRSESNENDQKVTNNEQKLASSEQGAKRSSSKLIDLVFINS